MPRSLEQLDIALAALELLVPQINTGLQETMRQNTLALESEFQIIEVQIGSPTSPSGDVQPTGFYATFAALQALLQSLSTTVSALQQQLADLQTQVTINQTTLANVQTDQAAMDVAIQQLQPAPQS